MKSTRPAEVFPPGDFIRDELEARGWTQADLAKIMGRPLSLVNLIISGKRGITAETACELSNAFDTSAEFWLNLESAYKLSKVVVPMTEIREMASLYATAPIKEMEQRGWIGKTESADELRKEVARFYSTVNLDAFKVAARASTIQGIITDAQLAWCVKCLDLALSVKAQPYVEKNAQDCEKSLRGLAAHPEGVSRISATLASFGIRLVVVEHLKGTKIDGAALWLGDGWDKPVIALSARFDRIDWLWHTLLHEFSHIKHRDSVALIDVDMLGDESKNSSVQDVENRANAEAASILIPRATLDSFIKRKHPCYSKQSIIQFAHLNKIHPGIIVGQLHHRNNTYSTNREMLVKIRDILISHSMTDGFGTTIVRGNK